MFPAKLHIVSSQEPALSHSSKRDHADGSPNICKWDQFDTYPIFLSLISTYTLNMNHDITAVYAVSNRFF